MFMFYLLLGVIAVTAGWIVDKNLIPQTGQLKQQIIFWSHTVMWMAIGAFIGWCTKKILMDFK